MSADGFKAPSFRPVRKQRHATSVKLNEESKVCVREWVHVTERYSTPVLQEQ